MANKAGFMKLACSYDFYLRGNEDGIYGFTYIPSFSKKEEICAWLDGFKDGKVKKTLNFNEFKKMCTNKETIQENNND